MPGKRIQIDEETWQQLNLLGHDQMKDFQELADEALRDLLKKYGRPVDLKDALRRSAGVSATVHQLHSATRKKPRRFRGFVDRAVEGRLVGARRLCKTAQLAHKLQRRRVNFILAGRRLEIEQRADITAHLFRSLVLVITCSIADRHPL